MKSPTNGSSDETALARDEAVPPRLGKALSFARQHPALSVLGAASIGLLGGLELAAGVLIGAGAAALLGRDDRPATEDLSAESRAVRDRGRKLLDRAPREAMNRARAVVQAARGKIAPMESTTKAPANQGEPRAATQP